LRGKILFFPPLLGLSPWRFRQKGLSPVKTLGYPCVKGGLESPLFNGGVAPMSKFSILFPLKLGFYREKIKFYREIEDFHTFRLRFLLAQKYENLRRVFRTIVRTHRTLPLCRDRFPLTRNYLWFRNKGITFPKVD